MSRRLRNGRSRARRLRHGERYLPSPFNALTPEDWRQCLSVIVDEATIEAALRERHLVPELPASIWLDLERMLERMKRMPFKDWKPFCTSQPAILLQLIVLFILDFDATVRAMQSKLLR